MEPVCRLAAIYMSWTEKVRAQEQWEAPEEGRRKEVVMLRKAQVRGPATG